MILSESKLEAMLLVMQANPRGVRFGDLCKVCDACFGPPRMATGSHRVYKTPWFGDPRVNIQNDRGMAKAYQVKQVLQALARLEAEHGKTD